MDTDHKQPDGALVDLAIIGGGLNGCGIARAAAGRGWSVFLAEGNDLGATTAFASTQFVHAGLHDRPHRAIGPARAALRERAVLRTIAPHIVRPLPFVLPHQRGRRPAWLLRLRMQLYDRLGGRRTLPASRTIDLPSDPLGRALKPEPRRGFAYTACWIDEPRLVVLNAMDAAAHGARIAPRTRCVRAERSEAGWTLHVVHTRTGARQVVHARALVNAAGPWAGTVLHTVVQASATARLRLMKSSHIVVRRLYPGEQAYILQNADRRFVFVIPYERDFTLIGLTDLEYRGDPDDASASGDEVAYLCRSASAYLKTRVTPAQVVWTFAGVRALPDEGAPATPAAQRDHALALDAPAGGGALLSVIGGPITTYRRLADAALARLAPHLPAPTGRPAGWTAAAPLPGGDYPADGFEAAILMVQDRYPFMPAASLRRLLRAYGTRITDILGAAGSMDALGQTFGADLTEAEVRYLMRAEWAVTAADILWRRSKLGLRLTAQQMAKLDAFMTALQPEQERVI